MATRPINARFTSRNLGLTFPPIDGGWGDFRPLSQVLNLGVDLPLSSSKTRPFMRSGVAIY